MTEICKVTCHQKHVMRLFSELQVSEGRSASIHLFLHSPGSPQTLMISWLSSLRGREVSGTRCVAGRHRTLESSFNRAPPDCYPLGVSSSSTHNALQTNKTRSAVERVMNLAGKPPSLCTMHYLHLQLNSTEYDLCLLFNGGKERIIKYLFYFD